MKIFSFLFLAILAMLSSVSLTRAQDAAAKTLAQQLSVPLPGGNSSQNTTGGNDLGEIAPVQTIPQPAMLTASTTQEVFYTDNVFYSEGNPVGSTAYLGNYTASFVPYSIGNWTPRLTAQYNMVRYDRVASGDFNNENLIASSQYVFGSDRSWTWTADVDLARFTAPHLNDHEFYKEVVYDNQISHVQALLHDVPLFLSISYDIAYHQANPGIFDRLDNQLSFALAYYPVKQLSMGPFVRPAARTYFNDNATQHGRSDFNLSEGFDATWTPLKYVSVSADIFHADNYSSSAGLSYSNTVPGLSVTGTIKF